MPTARRHIAASLSLALAVTLGACGESPTEVSVAGVLVPPPALDLPAPTDGSIRTVYLAGGCFWGVEAVFEHVRGVVSAVNGYVGGSAQTANYETVSQGTTAHAETVEVRYDPKQITYGKILQIFFSVAHDPTQIEAQFPDVGHEYRSVIFYQSEAERGVVRAYIDQLDAAHVLPKPIATQLDPMPTFYVAEERHQDYLAFHTNELYIVTYDFPKLAGLRKLFPEWYRDS